MSEKLKLEAIPHSPANNEELNDYARGVIEATMKYPSVNCVASILARVRDDNATITLLYEALNNAQHLEGPQWLKEQIKAALDLIDTQSTEEPASSRED